ncbi:MAG: glycosyltransferase [Bacteroidetes bacterium]|nr:glycosyltransferase [Bacteroidota bacterium]
MIIAVNISFLTSSHAAEYSRLLVGMMSRVASRHTEHSFVFIVNKDFRIPITGSNIQYIKAEAGYSRAWRWKWWTAISLPSILKKAGASVLLSASGYGCPKSGIPEAILLPTLEHLHKESLYTRSKAAFVDKNLFASLSRAVSLFVFIQRSAAVVHSYYQIPTENIHTIPIPAHACFQPLAYADRQPVKERYTGGTEYLLYNGPVHAGKNIINLLKAFSVFKKRQKTSMKLVFAKNPEADYSSFTESLKTYVYRNDIVFAGELTTEERAALTGAAYALVYPAIREDIPVYFSEALQCGIPVIVARGSAAEEVAGEACLYANTTEINDMAEKIMLLYKDENRRSALVMQSQDLAIQYAANFEENWFEKYILRKVI